ncbi:MAG: TIM barrel protein [Acidobacteriaceae bacterium]|nr:TIM barrel protein [Acidobacteriaceae bacterium]MBV9780608.1 TIM barrel protein [Acidobacteriaceae bacterium]
MRFKIGRREFLGFSFVMATSLKSAEPPANFPTDPRQRLAVSSYPFRAFIDSPEAEDRDKSKPGMTLAQFAQALPTRLQVTGIEPWSKHFESLDAAYLRDLSRAFKAAGLRVVNIPVDAPVKLCGSSSEDREAGQTLYRKWVDAAVTLGSPGVRVHAPEGDLDCAVQNLEALAEYGSKKNIVINLENDEPRAEDPSRIVRIIQTANTPYLRALPDFCNSMLIKNDEQYNESAMQSLFAHAFNISHVKDEEHDDGKTYRVNVDRIFAVAKKSGYRGYFSIEWEGIGDPYEGTQRLLQQSLKNLA